MFLFQVVAGAETALDRRQIDGGELQVLLLPETHCRGKGPQRTLVSTGDEAFMSCFMFNVRTYLLFGFMFLTGDTVFMLRFIFHV